MLTHPTSTAFMALAALIFISTPVASFPDKPINVTVCTPAGGANDRTIRSVEQVAKKHFGQPITIRYREGAGGTLAMQDLLKAERSGYELVFCDNGGAILAPIAQGLNIGPDKIIPVAQLGYLPWVLTARTDSGLKSVEDFVNRAKAARGAYKAPITSIAGADHYVWLLFARESGIGVNSVTWTPFGGGGPKLRAIIAGETEIDMLLPSLVKDHVATGTMTVLAVSAEKRLEDFPGAPTFKELGLDVVDGISIVLYAPAGTPEDRIAKLREGVESMKKDAELAQLFKKQGQDIAFMMANHEFAQHWTAYWKNAGDMLRELAKPR